VLNEEQKIVETYLSVVCPVWMGSTLATGNIKMPVLSRCE